LVTGHGDAEAANCLGLISEKEGNIQKALEWYDKSMALGGCSDSWFNSGMIKISQNNVEDGVNHI
jgi:hypothetical protein